MHSTTDVAYSPGSQYREGCNERVWGVQAPALAGAYACDG